MNQDIRPRSVPAARRAAWYARTPAREPAKAWERYIYSCRWHGRAHGAATRAWDPRDWLACGRKVSLQPTHATGGDAGVITRADNSFDRSLELDTGTGRGAAGAPAIAYAAAPAARNLGRCFPLAGL